MEQEALQLLVIEQDAAFGEKLRDVLRQMRGLQAVTTEAPDLSQALRLLTEDKAFDVIIMDLCLPDGAGFANLPLLHEQAPQAPVLVIGDIDEVQVGVETVHAGGQDYLVKSQIDPASLERAILYNAERYRNDRAVQDSEQLYHGMIDDLSEGVFRTTVDGNYLFANQALARIYGYDSPAELIRSLTDIGRVLYVDPNRRLEFLARMQAHDELSGFESQIYRRDGSTIWISENCSAKRDVSGRLLCYEGTVEDITARRRAEEDLRTSEALYHSLVETLPQNIFRKDLQGRFTFANQHFCTIVGRPLSEIVGKTDYALFEPELARKYQEDDQRVLRTGQPYETVEENQPSGHKKVYVQVVKTPLYGADGKLLGLQGIFWDITAQKLADEKIRRANSQLALSRKQLREKNQEMEDDLKMAKEIQQNILPQQYPIFPVAAGSQISALQFDHLYRPSGSVGGDFFTVSALSETEAAVFVCDVAGHGIRSALVTAMIRALVEELNPLAPDPGRFLEKLNGDLCAILKNTGSLLPTTAFYLVAQRHDRPGGLG